MRPPSPQRNEPRPVTKGSASPQRERPPPTTAEGIHRLKNGAPAHVLTLEDRRKAAAVTNEIRREKRALLDQLELNREIEAGLAKREARRRRKREQMRRRRAEERYL